MKHEDGDAERCRCGLCGKDFIRGCSHSREDARKCRRPRLVPRCWHSLSGQYRDLMEVNLSHDLAGKLGKRLAAGGFRPIS
jgi:hypothetical protein